MGSISPETLNTFDVDNPVDGREAAPDSAPDDVHEAWEVGPLTDVLTENLAKHRSSFFDLDLESTINVLM